MKNPRQITAVESLFDRWPGLVGFSVQDTGSLASEREWVRLDERLAVSRAAPA